MTSNPKVPYVVGITADTKKAIIAKNENTGESIMAITDDDGHAIIDLANMPSGYEHGHRIYFNQCYGIIFEAGEIAQTERIAYQDGTIKKAKPLLYGVNLDRLSIQLSADDGSNWESATNNTDHTFTNTGTALLMKITASGEAVVTEIKCEYSI